MANEPVFIEIEEPGINKQGTDIDVKESEALKDGKVVNFGDNDFDKKQGTNVLINSLENPKTV